jgi:hypothetical protein
MSLSTFMDQSAAHKRATATKDAIGGTVNSFTTLSSAVPCAVWPKDAGIVKTFARADLKGTHALVTTSDRGAKATDKFTIGTTDYLVEGVLPFSNAGVSPEVVIVHDVTKRTV